MEAKANRPILHKGTGTPYLAIFDNQGIPVMNPLTGIPLGAYISSWSYLYDEEKENLATLVIDTGNPDTVDVEALQENRDIFLQWGYIFSDGTSVSSQAINIKVRDFDCVFDSTGTHITIKCIDGTNLLRFMPPHKPTEDADDSMVKFLDAGCGLNVGVIIERFE